MGKADRTGSCTWGGVGLGDGGSGGSSTSGSGSGESTGSDCVCTELCTTGSWGSSHVDSCTVVGSSHAIGAGGSGSGCGIISSTLGGCSGKPGGGAGAGVSCGCAGAGGVGAGFSCGRAISAQDNPEVAGFFESSLGGPGIGVSGLACTAGEGMPLGFVSTPHA